MPTLHERDISALRSTRLIGDFRKMIKRFPNSPVIISEGDSWFAFPPKFLVGNKPSNIVDHVQKRRRFNLLRMERSGDEAISMISGAQQHKLSRYLKEFGDKLDILLFSGGGNDIVGPWDMNMFLNKKTPGKPWMECIKHDRFNRKLQMVKLGYQELLDIQNEYCPNCKIITHSYDWPIPSDTGARFFLGGIKIKPWMKPYMDEKGITGKADQKAIAKYMLSQFGLMLKGLADQAKYKDRLIYINTQGTLDPAKDWLNEIHATSKGYKKVADRFMVEINKIV